MNTYNSKDAADILHCTQETVEGLARDGKIPALKVGRSWIFHEVVLDEWLQEKSRQNLLKNLRPGAIEVKYPSL